MARKTGSPWQIAPLAAEKVQVCIRAADMSARGMKYAAIAAELGLPSAIDARKCAERGYSLAPGEDYQMARRKATRELDMVRERLWGIADDPGPATTVSGKPITVTDPDTGEQVHLPDKQVQIAALNGIRAVNAEYRKLYGTDAPKQTVSVHATAPLEDLQAAVAQMRAEVAQAEAEALREAQQGWDDDPGIRALPPASASAGQ